MKKIFTSFTLFLLIFISGCLPEQQVVTQQASDNALDTIDNENEAATNTQLAESYNFLQLSGVKYSTSLPLFSNYSDTFLIRGNEVLEMIKDYISIYQTNYCLVAEFENSYGTNAKNLLILSARIRSYYNSSIGTKEYFLQVAPNDSTINQGDCLNVSMTTALQAAYPSYTSYAYALEDICPECNTSLNSEGLQIYSYSGTKLSASKISLSHLSIQMNLNAGSSSTSTSTCSENSQCTSLGYNCCLSNQCVNHGSVKSDVDTTSSDYLAALANITENPSTISNFENYFYVCPLMVPADTDDEEEEEDPYQNATDLLTELTQLYNCTTPVVDEISICSITFKDASELMDSGAYSFKALNDDLNFSTITGATLNNIVRIDYGGVNFFKEKILSTDDEVALNTAITLSSSNDVLNTAQIATFQISKPTSASNDIVTLYYKVDGTCEKLGSSLARCTKYYTQGQSSNPKRSSDHSSGNNEFALPSYADTSYNVIVKVNDSTVAQGDDTWSIVGNSIVFDDTEYPIYDNQKLEILYYVTTDVTVLTQSKYLAQDKINDHCTCDPNEEACSLVPEYDDNEELVSYSCKYPDNDTADSLLNTTVYVSSKSVPHRFYDENGVYYDIKNDSSADPQEGNEFKYNNNDKALPNNIANDIGFNEIYGSMNVDANSALPPTVITVEKGTTYDIYTDSGAFSTCTNCGSDYFSTLQKIFPYNFNYKGGGYRPSTVESRRIDNASKYNADDFRFGRACFVPATMIPWTHVANENVITQRRNRLEAQHFLFANGYNKDWYGFDYGSLIGSFDGVKWFSIGNTRRIEAESNKLFLAVNAYFGDVTLNNSYEVTVSEMTSAANSGSLISHDTESDGAECQKLHYCSVDTDCITQLGYDYVCENVSGHRTSWPSFDSNANELSGSRTIQLLSLIGGNNGQSKRCVYRGVGAICEEKHLSVDSDTSYTGSAKASLHACSPNSYCETLDKPQFNNRISRFAVTAATQNNHQDVTTDTDTFGLGTRILGRPYAYFGDESVSATLQTRFSENNVNSICIPGKDLENSSSLETLNYRMSADRIADKINNTGVTLTFSDFQNTKYFAACPATDEDGNYTHLQNLSLTSEEHLTAAMRNNISTNSLKLNVLASKSIFNDESTLVSQIGLHQNSCLRAPGASCFSDFECAPNRWITNKFTSITDFNGEISTAEENFWEQDLVCRNTQTRYVDNTTTPNPLYELTAHRCCRETGNSIKYDSQTHENSEIEVVNSSGTPLIPGYNQDINDPKRYSSTHVVYDKLISETGRYPSFVSSAKQPTSILALDSTSVKQYNTLYLHNSRMCCTGHWVRKFASGTNGNGGGYAQNRTKVQNIPMTTFKPLSWNQNNIPALNTFPTTAAYDPANYPYACTPEDYLTSDCEVKNLVEGATEETKYLEWFAKFELIGIPQVLIETNEHIYKPLDADQLNTTTDATTGFYPPLDNTIKDVINSGTINVEYNGKRYYSAADYDNFEIGTNQLKKVFSENEFNCCIPTGYEVEDTTAATSCCTGTLNTNDDDITRCCLPDYTNVSVYTNRYVSSEGAYFNGQEVSDSDIDPTSGYIKKEIVAKMAETMCCSGKAMTGRVVGNYLIPITNDRKIDCQTTRRWLYLGNLDDDVDVGPGASLYEYGVKWNQHVYCVPDDFEYEVGCE